MSKAALCLVPPFLFSKSSIAGAHSLSFWMFEMFFYWIYDMGETKRMKCPKNITAIHAVNDPRFEGFWNCLV